MQSLITRKVQVPLLLLVLLGVVMAALIVLVVIGNDEDNLGGTVAENVVSFDSNSLVSLLNSRRSPALNLNTQLTTAAQNWANAGGSGSVADYISSAGYTVSNYYSNYSYFRGAQDADSVANNWYSVGSLFDAQFADVGIGAAQVGTKYYYTIIVAKGSGSGGGGTTVSSPAEQAAIILQLVNSARTAQGRCALTSNDQLAAAALGHSQDMSSTNVLDHAGSNGSTPDSRISAAGYTGATGTGENVLGRMDVNASAAYEQWWGSAEHQANMLNTAFTEIGVAYAGPSSSGVYYYTMVLGSKTGGCQ